MEGGEEGKREGVFVKPALVYPEFSAKEGSPMGLMLGRGGGGEGPLGMSN